MNLNEITTKRDLIELEQRLVNKIKDIHIKEPPKKFLRTKQVCDLLSISPSTLQNLRNRNLIPYQKIGGSLFYKLEDVEAVLDGNPAGIKR